VTSLENAPLDSVIAEADRIVQGEDYRPPEPFMPLQLGIQVFQWTFLKVRMHGAPNDILDNLQQWMTDAQGLLDRATAAAAPPPAPPLPPGGIAPPQAKPDKAPRSDLLPNAPGANGSVQ